MLRERQAGIVETPFLVDTVRVSPPVPAASASPTVLSDPAFRPKLGVTKV